MLDPMPPFNDHHQNGTQPDPAASASPAEKLPQHPRTPPLSEMPGEMLSPGMKRDIRRAFLILLGVGLAIGIITAAGVVWVMDALDLMGVPAQTDS